VIDGDTVIVGAPGSKYEWRIRLIDTWRPEPREPGGKEAKQYAKKVLGNCQHPAVFIPTPEDCHNLLSQITFDRIPGYIFVSETRTLNEMLVDGGHATKTKRKS
jgi:endonuclease YncB( thermonuclease family)